ncbi:MAG: hypothetical protein ABIH87_03385 [bacterium]
MSNLQEVFNRIKETQKKQKEINSIYRDALASSQQYQEITEELKVLRDKKRSLEGEIKQGFTSELDKLESIKLDIKTDKEVLNDVALTTLMKGQTVQVKDEYDNEYEPVFSVNFKKT